MVQAICPGQRNLSETARFAPSFSIWDEWARTIAIRENLYQCVFVVAKILAHAKRGDQTDSTSPKRRNLARA